LNASSGIFQWSYETGGAIYSSPAVANGVVYVGSTDNNVYAIGPNTSTANSGTRLNTYYIIIAAVAVVFVVAAVISLLLRKRPK
jgi:outer membrane protein assembly factor BamB